MYRAYVCIENAVSALKNLGASGALPLDPHQRLCPWTLPGHLSGPQDPKLQGSRVLRASIFCSLHKRFLLMGHPASPCPRAPWSKVMPLFTRAEPLFPTTKQIVSHLLLGHRSSRIGVVLVLRGYCTPGPYFWRLCVFSLKKYSNFGQCILSIWSEMFKGNQKSQFYFSRDHCCKVTVKMCKNQYFQCFEP